MIVLLLIVIACVLLFGKENVKSTILALLATILVLGIIGSIIN